MKEAIEGPMRRHSLAIHWPPASLAFVQEDNGDDQGDEHDIRQFVPPTKTNRGTWAYGE